jgi:glycosyltransferase involved in cell wall biosynthesis
LKHPIFRHKKKYDQYPEEPGVLHSSPDVSEFPVYRKIVANNIPYDPNSIIEYKPVVFSSDKQTISVVLFIRNMELSYLNHSLFTLSNQSVSPLEIILVESSNTREFISRDEEVASRYPLVRVIYAPTDSLNLSYSLNVGIQAAKGDYIMFAQVDLLYSIDVISCVYEIIRPNVIVQGPRGDITEGTNIPDAECVHKKWKKLVGGIFSGAPLFPMSPGTIIVVTKDLLMKIRGFDEIRTPYVYCDVNLLSRITRCKIETTLLPWDRCQILHIGHPTRNGYYDVHSTVPNGTDKYILVNHGKWGLVND